METVLNGRYEFSHGLAKEEVKALSPSELDMHTAVKSWKKMYGLLLKKCILELKTPQCHRLIFQHFW